MFYVEFLVRYICTACYVATYTVRPELWFKEDRGLWKELALMRGSFILPLIKFCFYSSISVKIGGLLWSLAACWSAEIEDLGFYWLNILSASMKFLFEGDFSYELLLEMLVFNRDSEQVLSMMSTLQCFIFWTTYTKEEWIKTGNFKVYDCKF